MILPHACFRAQVSASPTLSTKGQWEQAAALCVARRMAKLVF